MGEYSFCNELKEEYKIEELNSETLKYRIDGFIHACDMDLSDSPCSKEISKTRMPYINKHSTKEDMNYSINFIRSYDKENGNGFVLLGKYNDLNIYFVNYFDKDKKRIVLMKSFHITIDKKYEDLLYQLDIKTTSNLRTKFVIKKNVKPDMLPGIVSFQSIFSDFNLILKLVESFVYNPDIVFNMVLNGKINSKVLSSKYLNDPLVVDEKLDKPVNGIRKIIKKNIK